jgi:predicted alpha/beta-hydrolase family hydrolase
MERLHRDGKRGPPDPQPILLATWRRMVTMASAWPGVATMVMAGKSMGGRMASMCLAQATPDRVLGAVYLGYPLHPAGQPHRLRDAHLDRVAVPQLFISGSKDPLCQLDLLRLTLTRLGDRARLWLVENGDHSLATARKQPLAGSDAWLDGFADFVRDLAPSGGSTA